MEIPFSLQCGRSVQFGQYYWGTIPGAWVRPTRTRHAEDIIRNLEVEKESLNLQVCVLTEQIEAQTEKIRDLEQSIKEHTYKATDNFSPKELLTRSSLEHHKLDLMAEVSHLKLRLASAEKDRRELDDRCRAVQRQVAELEAKLLVKDAENSELRLRLGRNGTLLVDSGDTEVEKLKRAVDNLMMTNEEKERKLEDLRRLLKRYRRVEEILVQAQGRKAVEELLMNLEDGDTSSNSSSTTPSVGEAVHRDPLQHTDDRLDGRQYNSSSSASSTPMHQLHNNLNGGTAVSSIPADCRQAMGMTRSNSCEDVNAATKSKVPPFKKQDKYSAGGPSRGVDGYGMLPKHCSKEDVREGKRFRGFHGLGKTLLRVRSGKRSCSAPNLGDQLQTGSILSLHGLLNRKSSCAFLRLACMIHKFGRDNLQENMLVVSRLHTHEFNFILQIHSEQTYPPCRSLLAIQSFKIKSIV